MYLATISRTDRNSELAKSVLEDDKLIDQMELEIDQLSIEILASQRPTEHDLRLVVSVAKITPILERIADHAVTNAAARLLFLAKHTERIGDYVKDICELNTHLTEAVFIKHSLHDKYS